MLNLQYVTTLYVDYWQKSPYGRFYVIADVYRLIETDPNYEWFFYKVDIYHVPGTVAYGSWWRLDYAWAKFILFNGGVYRWFVDRGPDYQVGASAVVWLEVWPPYQPRGYWIYDYIAEPPYVTWTDTSNMANHRVSYEHDIDPASVYGYNTYVASPGFVVKAKTYTSGGTACSYVDGYIKTRFVFFFIIPWYSYTSPDVLRYLDVCYP